MAFKTDSGDVLYVDIIVNDSKTSSWAAFVSEYLIYFGNKDSNVKNEDDLFNYEGNKERIAFQYTDAELAKYGQKASKELLKFGTMIRVPKTNLMREILPNAGNLAVNLNDLKLSMPADVLETFQNKSYKPINIDDKDSKTGNTFLGNAYRVHNNISVWCYCKALGGDSEKGKLINITPFIDNLTTNVGENGGNFIISVAPITCEYDEKDGWVMTKDSYSQYAYNDYISALIRDTPIYQKDNEFKQKKFFFHHLVQPNDLLFIQFEALENERLSRVYQPKIVGTTDDFYPKQTPAGRCYDMIGLVDSANKKFNAEGTVVDIEICGRDFMKTLIDDGCYIYPLDYAQGFNPDKGQAVQRVLGKELYFFKSFIDVSVGYLVNFVMNALSNVAVIKDETLFSGWGDRASYRYEILNNNPKDLSSKPKVENKQVLDKGQIQSSDNVLRKPAEGIWQIIKLSIDPNVSKLRLVDTSITDYQGSLLNYINKVCQKPFCEFFGDTYGDQYHFVVRKPPFNQEAFLECFDKMGKLEITEDNIYEEDLRFDDSEIFSWYRLRPAGSFIDKNWGDSMASQLTIWLEEFAELFGAKSYDITTIYGQIYNTDASTESVEELLTQFRKDLIYMVESTIYLPFTRKGTITIIPGDRRIKRGMVIRHRGTDELFYVDSVTNTASVGNSNVDRKTILTVSRGMVEIYARNEVTPKTVDKYSNKDNVMSYFNLVDFGLDLSKDTSKTTVDNIKINKNVLNFFLKRKQFIDKYTVGSKDLSYGE